MPLVLLDGLVVGFPVSKQASAEGALDAIICANIEKAGGCQRNGRLPSSFGPVIVSAASVLLKTHTVHELKVSPLAGICGGGLRVDSGQLVGGWNAVNGLLHN